MGTERVDRLKEEFALDVVWQPFEIHPEIPPPGLPRQFMQANAYLRAAAENVRRLAEECGLDMKQPSVIANSHLALAAAEFAKEHGRFDEFHMRVFEAYYREDRHIGEQEVVLQLATEVGLDDKELKRALEEGRYEERFDAVRREVEEYLIGGAPTFLIDRRYQVVGAQPYLVLKDAVQRVIKKRGEAIL